MTEITTKDSQREVATPEQSSVEHQSESTQPDDAGRQCSRCRRSFPIEADTHPMELLGWWTCRPCTDALLPGRRRATTAGVDPTDRP